MSNVIALAHNVDYSSLGLQSRCQSARVQADWNLGHVEAGRLLHQVKGLAGHLLVHAQAHATKCGPAHVANRLGALQPKIIVPVVPKLASKIEAVK